MHKSRVWILNGGIISTCHALLLLLRPYLPDVMTILRPSGHLLLLQHTLRPRPHSPRILPILQLRTYAPKPSSRKRQNEARSTLTTTPNAPIEPARVEAELFKSALQTVEGNLPLDPINPPLSTLPPPIQLPERGSEHAFLYLIRLGRAYVGFYKSGVKAVYYNYKASKLLKARLQSEHNVRDITVAVQKGLLSRSEFQLLERNRRDIGKVPFFALLVLVFGEWLPLIVPFMPGVVPGTCRIPSQIRGMREKAVERRRASFRSGVPEPAGEGSCGVLGGETTDASIKWPMAFDPACSKDFLRGLRADQLLHVSTTLNLHGNLWTRLQLPPPTFILRPRIARRLAYIAQDDALLHGQGIGVVAKLSHSEVDIACEERGMDIFSAHVDNSRKALEVWLRLQGRDGGQGRVLRALLFRRPNVWADLEREIQAQRG